MESLAIIILTYNEEVHIERALKSISRISTEIFVIDSFSTDRTVEIARRSGAVVLQHPFVNQAQQFQWALNHAPVTANWVMRLDADEVVEPDLAAEIEVKLSLLPPDVTGVNLKRKHVFMGRWIRHGGRYPLILLRIWRRGSARSEQRWMDEHMLLTEGRAVIFQGGFADINLNDIGFFTRKHERYATREAVEVINSRRRLFERDPGVAGQSGQAGLKRILKEIFYNPLPFELSSTLYFLIRYVLQLGFLDGREGLIYHFLHGYWYRFLVGARVTELERDLGNLKGREALKRLAELTGLELPGSSDLASTDQGVP